MRTQIIPCTCQHKQQDVMYGKSQRVCNPVTKADKTVKATFRCTVCGKQHQP